MTPATSSFVVTDGLTSVPLHRTRICLKDDQEAVLRPICPADEALMVAFHRTLSERSVRDRYFHSLHLGRRIDHERLTGVCQASFDTEMAFVAERNSIENERSILGVGRLSRDRGSQRAEIAIVIGDPWQGLGLGQRFVAHLIEVGRSRGIEHIMGYVMPDNWSMQAVFRKAGFQVKYFAEDQEVRATWTAAQTR